MKKQLLLIFFIYCLSIGHSQTPGQLNPNYGVNGLVTSYLNDIRFTTYDAAYENYLITVLGTFSDGNKNNNVVLRFNNNGELDTSFGVNGMVVVNEDFNTYAVNYLDAFPDGSFVISREAFDQSNPQIIKYTPQGDLDLSFGVNGIATIDLVEDVKVTSGLIAFPTNNKIVVPLKDASSSSQFSYLLKLTADGQFDPTFSNNGLTDPLDGIIRSVDKETFNGVGNYVVTHGRALNNSKLTIIEYTGDLLQGPFDISERAAIYSPNGIMLSDGSTLRRFLTNIGDYDINYGEFGRFNSGFNLFRESIGGENSTNNIIDYANGDILIYGHDRDLNDFHFRKARPNGGLVNDFSPDGFSEPIDMLGYQDFLVEAFKMDNAEVLAVGYSSTDDFYDATNGSTTTLSMVRLQSNTQPDPNFGNRSGRYILEPNYRVVKSFSTKKSNASTINRLPVMAISEQPLTGNKFIQAVNPYAANENSYVSGQLETSYSDIELYDVLFYEGNNSGSTINEHLLGVGSVNSTGNSNFMLVRFSEVNGGFRRVEFGGQLNQIIETDLNNGSEDIARAVTTQNDNGDIKLLVAGTSNTEFVIVRYVGQGNDAGTLDIGFGTNGILNPTIQVGRFIPSKIVTGNDGNIYVSGELTNGSDKSFVLKKFSAEGIEDLSFQALDTFTSSLNNAVDFVINDDGSFLVLGNENISEKRIKVRKYDSSGNPDTSFGTNSYLYLNGISGDINAEMLKYLAGNKYAIVGKSSGSALVALFDGNGNMDNGFANNGILIEDFGLTEIEITSVELVDSTSILVSGTALENGNRTLVTSEIFVDTTVLEYTAIPDPEFEQYLVASGIDITPNDGRVLTSAVTNETILDIHNYNIEDFTGLEDFRSLQSFTLLNNQATNISGLVFNNNPNLNNINIVSVPNLSNIDISANNNLTNLTVVTRGTAFSSIDLTGKQNITSLLIADTGITSIDLTDVPNLSYLGLQLNQSLTTVSTTNLPLLEEFETYESGITSIDLSNNPNVTRLTSYRSFNGALTNVNLKNGFNSLINNLQLENNPNLTCIEVDSNLAGTMPNNWVLDPQSPLLENCGINCASISFSDPVFEAFLLNPDSPNRILDNNGNPVNLNQNGQVCSELATTVTYLDLSNTQNIEQLIDLYHFPALVELNIGGDLISLANIDLTQNLNLEVLTASGFKANGFLLQLRNNTNLRELYAYNSGSVLDINPQDNPNLEVLSVGGFGQNPFPTNSSINLSEYQNLKEFRALELSGLSEFGLSRASNLTRVEIFDTSVESVDLSGSGLLEEVLLVLNNNLVSVNVQNGTNNPLLQFLSVDANATDTCVQVDDLSYANEQVGLGNWSISSANFSENCDTISRPTIQWGVINNTIEGETIRQPVVLINGEVATGTVLDLSFGLVSGGTAQPRLSGAEGDDDDFVFVSGGSSPVTYGFGVAEGIYDGLTPIDYQLLTLLDDQRYEGNETLRIEILTQDLEIIGNPILEYTIIDDDYRVDVTAESDIIENGGSSIFTITLLDGNGNLVDNDSGQEIQLNWLDIGTADQGIDYVLSGNGIISNGQSSTEIIITSKDDAIFEGLEFVGIEIQEEDGYFVDINGVLPNAQMGIIDNDNNIVLQAIQTGSEGVQDATFSINLQDENGNLATNGTQNSLSFDIALATGEGSSPATLGIDFVNGLKNLVGNTIFIDSGFSSVNFGVEIIDDTVEEELENFIVNIGTVESEINLANSQIIGQIIDNDGAVPVFEIAPFLLNADNATGYVYNFTEGSNQELQLAFDFQDPRATPENFGPFDFLISTVDGDALGGDQTIDDSDYKTQSNIIVTLDFDLTGLGLLTIEINDDTIEEDTEFFFIDITENESRVILTNADVNGRVRLRVNILDNDTSRGTDTDNDGILDTVDNCPATSNSDQADLDNDGIGDICDSDADGDDTPDTEDAFPLDDSEDTDTDGDGIGNNADSDDDGDGVLDSVDDCPLVFGTGPGNGCLSETSSINQGDIQLLVLSETCANENNGSFQVTITNQEYSFNVSLDGTFIGIANSNSPVEQNNLVNGNYQVCLTIEELPNFKQCFGIVISTYERLIVETNGINATNLKASFKVQGSKRYEVLVNDNIYKFQFESTSNKILEIPVHIGENVVSITGESDCQGVFTDTIIIGNATLSPNPVKNILYFTGFESVGKAQINIHTISGSLVKTISQNIQNGDFNIQLSDLPKGIYLFRVVSEMEDIEFKIIKE